MILFSTQRVDLETSKKVKKVKIVICKIVSKMEFKIFMLFSYVLSATATTKPSGIYFDNGEISRNTECLTNYKGDTK